MRNDKMKRDPVVELARILGCLIVIGVHTCLNISVNGSYDKGKLFIALLFADGVAVFWVILGFFLFNHSNYIKLLAKTARSILLPLLLFSMFLFYFNGWLIDGTSLSQSLTHAAKDYIDIVQNLIRWNNFAPNAVQLWYLYAYLFLFFCFPILKSFADYLDADTKRQKIFVILSVGIFVMNDISRNAMGPFSHHSFNAVIPAAIEALWGHILYRHREFFRRTFLLSQPQSPLSV